MKYSLSQIKEEIIVLLILFSQVQTHKYISLAAEMSVCVVNHWPLASQDSGIRLHHGEKQLTPDAVISETSKTDTKLTTKCT